MPCNSEKTIIKKILIIDSVHEIILQKLKEAGLEIIIGTDWNKDKIVNNINDFYGIILRSRITIDKSIIDIANNLKFIGRVGSGMESIDTDYCKEKGIVCLNSPEGNRDAVGEHAIAMLLAVMNNICKANKEVKSRLWLREANRGIELKNKTVGIIGYGNMGSSFAEKLSGFACNVISYDKYKNNYSDSYTKEVELQEIFEKSDILSIHIPLNSETKYMINNSFISKFKKPFFLINTSRGLIVKTNSIVEALKSGKILGAALDVIEYEDTSFEKIENIFDHTDFRELVNNEKVILSPHIAGWTNESKLRLAEVLIDKILALPYM